MYIIHTPFGQKSITTEADFKNYTMGMEIIEYFGYQMNSMQSLAPMQVMDQECLTQLFCNG
jgi:hypothetical protein